MTMSSSSTSDLEKGKDDYYTPLPPSDLHDTGNEELSRDTNLSPFDEINRLKQDIADNQNEDLQSPETSDEVNSIDTVPNGGARAWLQVVGTFFFFFNTWGIINAFGIYEAYYQTGVLFQSTPSDISWIGSVQGFLLLFVGTLCGPIYDAGYARLLLGIGSFLVVLAQMMLSLCSTYWEVFLAQGVCLGLGTACLYVPGIAILSTYFNTRLATATGIAATGSSIGGLLYPIIFDKLQPKIGFAWASRVLGFVALGTLIIGNLCTKVRVVPHTRRKFFDVSAWKEGPYTCFVAGLFFGFAGLYTVFFYIQTYALQSGIVGPSLAFYLLTILNAASTFGRLIPNYLGDSLGPLNIIIPCVFATSLLTFCLIAVNNVAGLIVLVAIFGFFSGSFVSLPPTIFVHLSAKNRSLIGTRMGMGFAWAGIGIIVGAPAAGAIQKTSGFTSSWIFGGVFSLVGAFFLLAARVLQVGWNPMVKI